jgi:hypothetical protein
MLIVYNIAVIIAGLFFSMLKKGAFSTHRCSLPCEMSSFAQDSYLLAATMIVIFLDIYFLSCNSIGFDVDSY